MWQSLLVIAPLTTLSWSCPDVLRCACISIHDGWRVCICTCMSLCCVMSVGGSSWGGLASGGGAQASGDAKKDNEAL